MSKLQAIIATMPQVGEVISIALRPEKRSPLRPVEEAQLSVENGLEGDHYGGRSKKRQVTLIQAEYLDGVAKMLGRETIDPLLTRRNIVVSGVNLLAFKNRRFSIGEAILEMTGPCEPCSRMETNFGPGGYNAMRGHGGICAMVVRDGTVRRGDRVRLVASDEV